MVIGRSFINKFNETLTHTRAPEIILIGLETDFDAELIFSCYQGLQKISIDTISAQFKDQKLVVYLVKCLTKVGQFENYLENSSVNMKRSQKG